MARLCFDYGHGGVDSGACYKGRKESNDVLSVGKAVAEEVRRHWVTVDETRTSDATVSLNDRSNFENRSTYDYFISFHRNAYEPEKAKGAETYTYLNQGAKAKGLAEKIQSSLVNVGFKNRGVKKANFHVLRETKAPAVLVEMGFIDNSGDNALFDSKRNEIVKAIAKAILSQLGTGYKENVVNKPQVTIKSSPSSSEENLYRVMSGSYKVRENAEQ
ncbi:N-acetylmuramoyl-L-alanine amidase family protein [Clostridium botulinum]|uniref:N-acetylmuramoyl-L-alanine amidase family protein n=1 Tax=Clostridium botulinum TaxID=1491 RepID=UPI00065395DE|nr:N-acetylmuramoyl-L-alanine amidase [Clostridium botulinum]QPW59767.1 N-acetylmuramoyl-L-alanine amidase [Clostridium botulinum]QPW62292.1 N-acetylmuramoyl-L-alanine amidase [Clostridium phage CWou-2020b]